MKGHRIVYGCYTAALAVGVAAAARAQTFPLDHVMNTGSQWLSHNGARYAGLGLTVISFAGLAWGEHGGGMRKAAWALLCVAGMLIAAAFVDYLSQA